MHSQAYNTQAQDSSALNRDTPTAGSPLLGDATHPVVFMGGVLVPQHPQLPWPAAAVSPWQPPLTSSSSSPAYLPLPHGVYPQGDTSLLLGDHLLLGTKEKIWRGEYIDLFTLLFCETEVKLKDGQEVKEREAAITRKVDRVWPNWLNAYTIYMGVMTQAYPSRALSMIKYQDIVHRAFREFSGTAWLWYDQNFRQRAALDPTLRWDIEHAGLWLRSMTSARPTTGDRADSGHLLACAQTSASGYSQGGHWVQSQQVCWLFNSSGRCSRRPCKFRHVCALCGGNHSSSSCQRARTTRQGTGEHQQQKRGSGNSGGTSQGQ
ncbi:uncharacterized protein LOC133386672 isoform X1 [Rhineura floridana]|uniref:uncharacterized protein LOC133386672 isoform X1 n=1 Tax=Rhineura floridana TaxID=261503 RepID=UPI002AC869B1|nr:uncharacterized protein LOC133386672 isoform X1 [Rhineura floridana]